MHFLVRDIFSDIDVKVLLRYMAYLDSNRAALPQVLRRGPNVTDLAILVVRSMTTPSFFSLTSNFYVYQSVTDFRSVPFRLFLGARLERNTCNCLIILGCHDRELATDHVIGRAT